MSPPNSPANMFPCTKAPRLPNIGLTSTRGSSGTRARKRSRSSALGLGICMRPPRRSACDSARPPQTCRHANGAPRRPERLRRKIKCLVGEQDGAEKEVPTRRTQMRDEEYSSEHVPAYGSQERPAIAARMRPHLRLAAVGTVIAVLDVVAAVWAVLRYPQFAGPDAVGGAVGDEWSLVAAVCAALMLAICAYQLW